MTKTSTMALAQWRRDRMTEDDVYGSARDLYRYSSSVRCQEPLLRLSRKLGHPL